MLTSQSDYYPNRAIARHGLQQAGGSKNITFPAIPAEEEEEPNNNTEPRPAAATDFFLNFFSMIHTKLVRSHDDSRARERERKRKRDCACLLACARSLLTATTTAAAAQQQLDPLKGSQKATFVGLQQDTKDSLNGLF
jgi:ribosome assembly protein YihI (activator of Der GTPase)